jgi:GST-like protein
MQRTRFMLELHTWTTPNGKKPAILLAELDVPYELELVDLSQGEQKRPDYLDLNPNGKIPTLVDVDSELGRVEVFESGAILQYLAEKYRRFMPLALGGRRAEVLSWLHWQVGGPGPIFGQLHHFASDGNRNDAAYRHFEKETKRLIDVLDRGLDNREYVAEEYSIADIAIYPWFEAITHDHASLFDGAKNVREWLHRVGKREAVKRGMALDGGARRAA